MFQCSYNIPSCHSHKCLDLYDKFYCQPSCGACWDRSGSEAEAGDGLLGQVVECKQCHRCGELYSTAESWAGAPLTKECYWVFSQLRDQDQGWFQQRSLGMNASRAAAIRWAWTSSSRLGNVCGSLSTHPNTILGSRGVYMCWHTWMWWKVEKSAFLF